jgi:hypothetical protein
MLILPEDTARLINRIASKSGRTPDDVVRAAVAASARSVGIASDGSEIVVADSTKMIASARAIAARSAARPVFDIRTDDEILGYDRLGIPA